MANETTVQNSYITDQEVHEADDCRENIPPDSSVSVETSKVKFQDLEKHACSQTSGENNPLSDTCTLETPAPTSRNSRVKAKSRISGLQSALTPILKYLNIGKKSPSPEPFNHGNSPPIFSFGNSTSKLTESITQNPKPGFSTSHSGQSSGIHWICDEYLPEITLLDVTCDSTMDLTRNGLAHSDCVPGIPVCAQDVTKKTEQAFDLNLNSKISSTLTPVRHLHNEFLPEISLLDVTADFSMQRARSGSARSDSGSGTPASAKEMVKKPEVYDANLNSKMSLTPKIGRSSVQSLQGETTLEATCDLSPADGSKNTMSSSKLRQTMSESADDQCSIENMSGTIPGDITHTISINEVSDNCEGGDARKAPLDVTQDISMASDSSRPSSENSGQTPAEDRFGAHPVNVTRDISSSSNMSVQCHMCQSSASLHDNTSSKNVTCEHHPEPAKTSNSVETDNTELTASHNTQLTCRGTSQNTTVSLNSTFTTVKSSQFSASMDSNTSAQMSDPQNKTLDRPSSNISSPVVTHTNQTGSSPKNTSETSSIINKSCSSVKANETFDVQNSTFNKHSIQKSSGIIILAESGTTPICLQNNTFEMKHVNGTITLSETASSDGHHNTFDKASPPKATATPKDNNTEVHTPELSSVQSEKTPDADPNAKQVAPPERTFEANPAVDVTSEANNGDTKVNLGIALPAAHRLSDCLSHQSMNMDSNMPNVFNLDDTLDLRSESLITSTPMPTCKMFNFTSEREDGKIIAAQKKLYGDGPSQAAGQTSSEMPSNIICDRKTLLTQPAAKSFLPLMKPPSQLLKYKPASTLPMKASGLPMTRQRSQAEALKNTAVANALQETKEIPSSYNLRPATTAPGPKKPLSGLRKPQQTGIPSGLQRTAAGLRPPLTRSNAPVSSNADKPHGPEAPNPVVKISQPKKHPLPRSETLLAAKKKKTDASVPSSNAEASTSSSDASSKAKNLKKPPTGQKPSAAKAQRNDAAVPASTAEATASCDPVIRTRSLKQPPTSHKGCANCTALEQQLKLKSEEIRRLKEELLKYSKQEDKC
ncbi:uncharacterized protein LOC115410169 [Sphaeramia orbicularis]|uniref:uncharacterized protein LOC115410169 n=1 Tax=Sphaeramia orbicularis TaxID=375764 RepID=UPI00118029E7|nr:uncharacterized protein LOC115410169 [Sphaeramia orbicularis]